MVPHARLCSCPPQAVTAPVAAAGPGATPIKTKKPNPKAQLPGCFEDMMDNFVLKYQGEAADDDTKVKQYVQSPAASMVREEKGSEFQKPSKWRGL